MRKNMINIELISLLLHGQDTMTNDTVHKGEFILVNSLRIQSVLAGTVAVGAALICDGRHERLLAHMWVIRRQSREWCHSAHSSLPPLPLRSTEQK